MDKFDIPMITNTLVPASSFLILQSVSYQHWARIRCSDNFASLQCTKRHILGTLLVYTNLAIGIFQTVLIVIRLLQRKIKWMTRLLKTCLYGNCVIGLLTLIFRINLPQEISDKGWTYILPGYGIYITGITLALISGVLFSYHQKSKGSRHAYVYCVHDIPIVQRGALIFLILFLTYVCLMSAVFSLVENWSFSDSMYWSASSLTTIGYGDFYPKTKFGKITMPFWNVVGSAIGGALMIFLKNVVLDNLTRSMTCYYHKALNILESDIAEPKTNEPLRFSSKLRKIFRKRLPKFDERSTEQELLLNRNAIHSLQEAPQKEIFAENYQNSSTENDILNTPEACVPTTQKDNGDEAEINIKDYPLKKVTIISFFLLAAVIILYGLLFSYLEGWSWGTGLYFSFISVSTVGYGDYCLKTDLSKALFMWFILSGSTSITCLFSLLSKHFKKIWSDTSVNIENRALRYVLKANSKKTLSQNASLGKPLEEISNPENNLETGLK